MLKSFSSEQSKLPQSGLVVIVGDNHYEMLSQNVITQSLQINCAFLESGAHELIYDFNMSVQSDKQIDIDIILPQNSAAMVIRYQGIIRLMPGSRCRLNYINLTEKYTVSSTLQYQLEEGSCLHSYYLLNQRDENFQEEFFLYKNATLTIQSVIAAQDNQHKVFQPIVHHCQRQSVSNTQVRSLMSGHSTANIAGLIKVEPEASCQASYHNKNLLLSPQARVEAQPQLAIYFDELSCSHGVTIGQLDPEQIFYLCSRGLEPAVARALMVQAFASELLDNYPQEHLPTIMSFYEHHMMESL